MMLNYYKRNFPQSNPDVPNKEEEQVKTIELRGIRCPVLQIHGLDDPAFIPDCLNDTWKWMRADLTLVTIPGAGHFVQHDAADLVTRTMKAWLSR